MRKTLIVALALVFGACDKAPTTPTAGPCGNLTINGTNINVACGGNVTQTTEKPTPTPGPSNTDCRVDWIRQSGSTYVPAGGEVELSITPMQTFKDAAGATQEVPVSDPCNNSRPKPKWASSDPRILTVEPFNTGFEAKVKRHATGAATITAEFEGRTVSWGVQASAKWWLPVVAPTPGITPCKTFSCPEPTPRPKPTPTPGVSNG